MEHPSDPVMAAKLDKRIRHLDAQTAGHKERRVLRKMLHALKDMPHLWNRFHKDYNDRHKLKDLYVLLDIYREFDPFATVCIVRRKVETLINMYVKEWQRVNYARTNLPEDYKEHQPVLWHYDDLGYMDPDIEAALRICRAAEAARNAAKSSTASVEQDASKGDPSLVNDNRPATSAHSSPPIYVFTTDSVNNMYLKQRVNAVYEPHKVDEKRNVEDVVEMFVDSQLKGVDKKQKEIALKLIIDTLNKAKTGRLTDGTCANSQGENK